LAQGSSASMGKHAGVMRAGVPQSTRRGRSLPRRACDEREATAWNPLTIAESMTALQCRSVSEALKELDTTARSGTRVASRWTWPRQSGLSPRGRSYHRLDRSPDNRKERPLTASWRLLMVRRLCDAGPAEPPDPSEKVHASHRSRRA
jgi:hypothetical protein